MQEHEYIYEHGLAQVQSHDPGSASELSDGLTGQEPVRAGGPAGKMVLAESGSQIEEREELRDRRATLRLGRGLTLVLAVSFLASLAAIWLSSTLVSAPDQLLPVEFLQMLADHRVLVLCVPVIGLVICYLALRSLTREIMVGPESRLDERQKILRDQAQRSAFKIVKFASVLVPVGFVLPHLPWFNASLVAPVPLAFHVFASNNGPMAASYFQGRGGPHFKDAITVVVSSLVQKVSWIQPASTSEVMLAGGLLLVCLLLMFSALPMAVLAWRGKA